MRESRTYGSGRGACDETHVPTATEDVEQYCRTHAIEEVCAIPVAVFLVALGIGFTQRSGEATEYPVRPIRIIVPWPAGGPTDAVARVLAQEMSDRLNQPVIVDNKAGATGTIGSDAAAKSSPDGYTLVVANTASRALAKISNPKMTYDPMVDFRIRQLSCRDHGRGLAASEDFG
jgi:tripartite-type tricarboxylate transporter receptor subunit TctC